VNEDPLENGWFMKIKIDDKGLLELSNLLNKDQYDKHIKSDDE
jgi:glycine cleavage system H lipoate-binding protein